MLRGRRAGPFARCAPALAREKNGAPSAPRRSRGLTPAASAETCHRHLSPASASRHKRRGRSASTRFPALCGSPRCPPSDDIQSSQLCGDARCGFRCTESSCLLRGEAGHARRRSRQGPAKSLRGRSCRARAVPRALSRKSKEPAGWPGGLPKTAPRRHRA